MTHIGFTGHQIIPIKAQDLIRDGIEKELFNYGSEIVGVSALAAGADQLFADIVLTYGGSLHVIIPCYGYERTFSREEDLQHYNDLLERADVVEILNHEKPSEDAYLDAGHRVVDLSNFLIAVWDGEPAKGMGGTADIVQYAKEHGVHVRIVWPSGFKH
jgi:hypothetical protein